MPSPIDQDAADPVNADSVNPTAADAASAGPSRRGLLAAFGASGAALALSTATVAHAADAPAPPPNGDAYYPEPLPPVRPDQPQTWRELFVLDRDPLFMNVGTVGSPARVVLDALKDEQNLVAHTAFSDYHYTFLDERTRISAGFGCDADELFLSGNTTDGVGTVLAGLDLAAGDEVLTTNHEHPAVYTPLSILRNRRGITVRQVPMPIGNAQRAEDYVTLFESAIGPKTKVLLFSAPIFRTGAMLPIRMIAEMAQRHGLITVVDGAHIPGMFAYTFRELGVDFIAGSGGKWQCGPARTGVLYIRNKVHAAFNPNPLPTFWPTVSSSQNYPAAGLPARSSTETASYDIAGIFQDTGNPSLAQIRGLDTACALWQEIGRQNVQDYILGLSDRMKTGLAARFGVDRLYSPVDDTRLHSALTTFNPFITASDVMTPAKASEFVTRLHDEYHITIRTTIVPVAGAAAAHNVIRVSTHLFHDAHDVDRFVDSAWRLAQEMG